MRELEKFKDEHISDTHKIGYLRRLVIPEMANYIGHHMSLTGHLGYGEFKSYVESQIALNRSAASYSVGKTEQAKKPPTSKSNDMALGAMNSDNNECCEGDHEMDYEHEEMGNESGMYSMGGKGKGGWPINGNCDSCGQFGHAWRHCPKLDESGKHAFAAKKGVPYKGSSRTGHKGGGKDFGGKNNYYGKGRDYPRYPVRQWTPWGKGGFGGKGKGLNEVGEWGAPDVWNLNGIHFLSEAAPMMNVSEPQKDVPKKKIVEKKTWDTIPVQNRFEAFTKEGEDEYEDAFPTVEEQESETSEQKKKRTRKKSTGAKFNNSNKKDLQTWHRETDEGCGDSEKLESDSNFMGTTAWEKTIKLDNKEAAGEITCLQTMRLRREKNRMELVEKVKEDEQETTAFYSSSLSKELVTFLKELNTVSFLGDLDPPEAGLNQMEEAGQGKVWKQVVSIVDSGAINNVAPPSISSAPTVESKGSINGMTYHTADGTRIPNLGQKTLNTYTENGMPVSQTYQIAEISRPLTSVGDLADAGNIVVFGRKGGAIVNPDTGRRLDFKREHGAYLMRTWLQEPAAEGTKSGFTRQG